VIQGGQVAWDGHHLSQPGLGPDCSSAS
jgi:hypothetical protein